MTVVPPLALLPAGAVARRARAWLAGAALTLAASFPAVAQQTQQPEAAPPGAGPRHGQQFQDWTLHCGAPEGQNPEVCEMRQRVVNQEGERVLLAAVGRLPNLELPGLLIVLPLGISLPPGAYLKIDQAPEERVAVERCEQQGCRIELVLEPELLGRLKAGTRATVGFHVYDGEGGRPRVDVPVSLLGFSAALAEVMK